MCKESCVYFVHLWLCSVMKIDKYYYNLIEQKKGVYHLM